MVKVKKKKHCEEEPAQSEDVRIVVRASWQRKQKESPSTHHRLDLQEGYMPRQNVPRGRRGLNCRPVDPGIGIMAQGCVWIRRKDA